MTNDEPFFDVVGVDLDVLGVLEAAERRQLVMKGFAPCCPMVDCHTGQVQIINNSPPALWRCRVCKTRFICEPYDGD